MISLEVEPYCQNCPNFEPDVHKDIASLNIGNKDIIKCTNTIIICNNKFKCNELKQFIEKEKINGN